MTRACPILVLTLFVATAAAQSGIDFVTIGAPGNAPWTGQDPFGFAGNRGRVDYEYRIGRTEITTAQWMEFVNTFSRDPSLLAPGGPTFVWGPTVSWGAARDITYTGPGIQWLINGLPQSHMIPVNGISWREAALYCNWLHNGKPQEWSAVQDGAYDASTFTTNANGTFNDQLTRHPGARYWIPSQDEWMKAAHYDPDRYGVGQAGWWEYSHTSDAPPVPGVPGLGQTSANVRLPGFAEWEIPLGAYPGVQSPWGLLDTSGGTNEWLEESSENTWRRFEGTQAGWPYHPELDAAWALGSEAPAFRARGFRIASEVPAPGTLWVCAGAWWWGRRKRR